MNNAGYLTLASGCWFGWQMVPGYLGERCVPYFSPVLMRGVKPLKSGKGLLQVDFGNALYAQGLQDFSLHLRVLQRAPNHMVAEIVQPNGGSEQRAAVLSHIEFEWVRRFCPDLWAAHPPDACSSLAQGSISEYLHEVFRTKTI
jgi:hypothetical protein